MTLPLEWEVFLKYFDKPEEAFVVMFRSQQQLYSAPALSALLASYSFFPYAINIICNSPYYFAGNHPALESPQEKRRKQ